MKLNILAVGTKMPGWVEDGFGEYQKRLPREWNLRCTEIAVAKRGKTSSIEQLKKLEGEQILAQVSKSTHLVALDVLGKPMSTPQLSERMAQWQMNGKDVCILIGGPDGLSSKCLDRADESISLSKLTLPHPLVRIVLAEQLYRAWTILQNHPYHK